MSRWPTCCRRLGQWAVLADFHTVALAAPLLLLTVERLVVARAPVQALLAAALAASAREDVGLAVAAFGLVVLVRKTDRRVGLALLGLGLAASALAMLVIRMYSGGVSPFDVRYGPTVGSGLESMLAALSRPNVLGYLGTLALSGGWLGPLSPLTLLPALPSVLLNVLSSSVWMAAGKAHYSVLVLPFIVMASAAGFRQLKSRPRLIRLATAGLALSSCAGYVLEGAGPLGGNYAPALVTDHARHAAALAAGLPPDAAVSASAALVPRVSSRARAYVFPAVLDADYVLLDLQASPAPTSAGDVFLRTKQLLGEGGWRLASADDGLLLMQRDDAAPPIDLPAGTRAAAGRHAEPR